MNIGIIGHIGANKNYTDGQTAKTKAVIEGLAHKGYKDIICADTYYLKHNPLRFLVQFLIVIMKSNKIIVLLSERGRKILFPILSKISSAKDIYHYAIGGQLADEAEKNVKYRHQISKFQGNWVESQKISIRLREMGVQNASYIPNFKCIQIIKKNELPSVSSKPLKFCMFSRVMREKGVEDAIEAIKQINDDAKSIIATLDIYGPIETNYKERFNSVITTIGKEFASYKGIVHPNESVSVLKKYYMLLFPTFWIGEGMPGTIIDAFSAGVPIIARRWKYCDDMIDDRITGYVYDFNKPDELVNKIRYAITNEDKTLIMKENCIKKAQEYSEELVMKKIIEKMQLDN